MNLPDNEFRLGEQLLAAVIASRWDEKRGAQLAGMMRETSVPGWLQAVEFHGLAGILATRHQPALQALGTEFREGVQRLHRAQAAVALQQFAETKVMLEAFALAGVAAIPLKGVVLSAQLYGDIAVRSSIDIDLLIDPRELDPAMDVLEALGYRPAAALRNDRRRARWTAINFKDLAFSQAGRFPLELHIRTELVPEAALPPLNSITDLESWALQNLRCQVLPGKARSLAVAQHALRSAHRWKWLYDVIESVGQVEELPNPWAALDDDNLERSQKLCLHIAAREWSLPVPALSWASAGAVWVLGASARAWRSTLQNRGRFSGPLALLSYRSLQLVALCATQASWRARVTALHRRGSRWLISEGRRLPQTAEK